MSENKKSGLLRRDVLQGTAIAGLATLASVKNLAAAPSETNEALASQPTPMPGNDWNTADILVETLINWGVTHAFGIVGDGINSIIVGTQAARAPKKIPALSSPPFATRNACQPGTSLRQAVCVGWLRRAGKPRNIGLIRRLPLFLE